MNNIPEELNQDLLTQLNLLNDLEDPENMSDISSTSTDLNKIIIKDVVLTICSIDRDWYNSSLETPFNFNVKLNSGLQNNYMMINYEPKNVVNIFIERAILNGRDTNISYTANNIDLTHYSYLNINIENIDYVTYGTNRNLEKALGIMMPIVPISSAVSTLPYVEYKNIITKGKEYHNNPLASLSKLNITITNPLGTSPTTYYDVLDIKNITYKNDANPVKEYLIIYTNTYFPESQYNVGDVIKFKNYTQINSGSLYVDQLEKFINREQGHHIIGVSTTDGAKLLKNLIYIPAPINASSSTGLATEEDWYSDITTMGNLNEAANKLVFSDLSGKLINTNLQTTVVVKVKTLDYETKFMNT